jgi:hypothetical protein
MSAGFPLATVAWAYLPVMGLWAWAAWKLGITYTGLRSTIPGEKFLQQPSP